MLWGAMIADIAKCTWHIKEDQAELGKIILHHFFFFIFFWAEETLLPGKSAFKILCWILRYRLQITCQTRGRSTQSFLYEFVYRQREAHFQHALRFVHRFAYLTFQLSPRFSHLIFFFSSSVPTPAHELVTRLLLLNGMFTMSLWTPYP